MKIKEEEIDVGAMVFVDGTICTEEELKLAFQYRGRLSIFGIKNPFDMVRWARNELAKPDGMRPLK